MYEPEGSGAERTATDAALDVALLRQVVEGSEEALAALYDRHAESVYATAVRMLRDASTAAEVAQDTFLTLWNRAELFDPARGSLRAWLLTVARNRALDQIRRLDRRGRPLPFSTFDRELDDGQTTAEWLTTTAQPLASGRSEPGPEDVVSSKEVRRAIARAVASLPPAERSVIGLAYAEDLSQAEIAIRLGWPMGTVKTRTRRALRRLRAVLDHPTAFPETGLRVTATKS